MHIIKFEVHDLLEVGLEIASLSHVPHGDAEFPSGVIEVAHVDGFVQVDVLDDYFEGVHELLDLGCLTCASRCRVGVLLKTHHEPVEVEVLPMVREDRIR